MTNNFVSPDNKLFDLARKRRALSEQLERCATEEDNYDADAPEKEAALAAMNGVYEAIDETDQQIMDYPSTTILELVVKARHAEAWKGRWIGHPGNDAKPPVFAFARDLERMAGIATPPPDGKIIDLLYGFGNQSTNLDADFFKTYVKLWEKRYQNAIKEGLPPEDVRMLKFAYQIVREDMFDLLPDESELLKAAA